MTVRTAGTATTAVRAARLCLCLLLSAVMVGCSAHSRSGFSPDRECDRILRGHAAVLFSHAFHDGMARLALAGFDSRRTVYQPVPDGMPLELEGFVNAHSSENPNGDLRANRRLVDIVDRVPGLTRHYTSTQESVEENYGMIINQAGPVTSRHGSRKQPPEPPPSAAIISGARQVFSRTEMLYLSPWEGRAWHTALARPADWAEPDAPFAPVELTMGLVLAMPFPSPWAAPMGRIGSAIEELMAQGVKIHDLRVRFDALVVRVERPWLRAGLFERDDWTLGPDERPGAISSGLCLQDRPDAMLPLLPVGFVAVKNISVGGIVHSPSAEGDNTVSLAVPGALLVGFVHECTPFSPRR